ncbi:MAG: hypothetical protein FJ388_11270, partial [Verrucomicrobia bacterium]|nr:hypothetical protein [Verrucomicrobiota bacterium]
WGPTDDGRIKPDIVANGVSLYSSLGTSDTSYGTMSGTSMSSPNAVGTAILLVDYYGYRLPGQAMRASTLKGLIIHTADDLGTAGPDYSYGWGLMNAEAAASQIRAHADAPSSRYLYEGLLTTATPSESFVFRWDGVSPIRATICWTDPAGTAKTGLDDRTAVLVNDLDLRITGPGGTPVYYPYVLNVNSPANPATTGDNVVDNVEQVYIAAPSAGTYTLTVSHKGTLSGGQQYYSLILSGQADKPSVTLTLSGSPMTEAGGVATVTATLSETNSLQVTVNLAFSGSATLNTDYTVSATSIVIPSGNTNGSITLTAVQDPFFEWNETIVVDIDSVVNGAEDGTQQVTASILDDDGSKVVIIDGFTSNVFPKAYIVGTNDAFYGLAIINGGVLNSMTGVVGSGPLASNNFAWVTGSNSLWSNTNLLFIGATGSVNSLNIENGGQVRNTTGYIGSNTVANSNSVLVTGAGSVWNNVNNLFVGLAGAFNSLTVANSGTVLATNIVMGASSNSTGNVITISGGALWATNAVGRGALDVRRGTLTLDSGTLTANRFYATNGANSVVNFNGGTLNSGGAIVSNGTVFTVGNGISAATMNLQTGIHWFANGIKVSINGTLTLANTGRLTMPLLANAGLFQVNGGTTIVTRVTNAGTFNQAAGVVDPAFFDNAGLLQMTGGTNRDTVFLNEASGRVLHSGGRHDVSVATNQGLWMLSGAASANLTNLIMDAGGGFTNAGGVLISADALGQGQIDVLNGTLTVNSGTVRVDRLFATNSASSLVNLNGGTLTGIVGSILNGGRFVMSGGTGMVGAVVNGSMFTQSGGQFGSVLFDNSGAFTFTGGTNLSSNFFNEAGGWVQQSGGEQYAGMATNQGAWRLSGTAVANLTNLIIDNGGGFTNAGAVLNSTNASGQGLIDVLNGRLILNSGTVRVDRFFATNIASSLISFNGGVLTGTVGAIQNGGQFVMTAGNGTVGTLINGSVFDQFGGRFASAFFDNSGAFTLTAGTNMGGPFFNETNGRVAHNGGQIAANYATNSGAWKMV